MLIATGRYKNINNDHNNGVVTVFDTEDATVEIVDLQELKKTGVVNKLHNYSIRLDEASVYGILDVLKSVGYVRHIFSYLYIGKRKRIHIVITRSEIRVNNIKIYGVNNYANLLYPFLWRDLIILRFVVFDTKGQRNYISSAIDSNGKTEYWSPDFSVASDKCLAVKIDTLSRGI